MDKVFEELKFGELLHAFPDKGLVGKIAAAAYRASVKSPWSRLVMLEFACKRAHEGESADAIIAALDAL